MFRENTLFYDQSNDPKNELKLIRIKLFELGIELDVETGHIAYSKNFRPIDIDFELAFVRHGETYGNCGQSTIDGKVDESLDKDKQKRIFQGNVDTEINQLTEMGKQQALDVAEKLKSDFLDKNWIPDVILTSPLSRAKQTALPFVTQNNLEDIFQPYEELREQSFGSWDNRRVCDFSLEDTCHLFYREQHALIKKSGINGNQKESQGECFSETLLRALIVLRDLKEKYSGKKVLMFSHSMFGAAIAILLGKGQNIENGKYLAFDGQRSDGSYYTMPHTTPITLNFELPRLQNKLL